MPVADINPVYMWVWRAWRRLHADRPWISGGMGGSIPGKIPLRDVLMYADLHDLDKDDALFLDACIGPMDDVFCKWQAEAKTTFDPELTT